MLQSKHQRNILVRKINLMRNFSMPDYFLFYCINPCKSGEIQIFGDFALTIIDLCRQENIACKFAHKVKKNGKLTAQNKVIFIKMATRLHSF